MQRKLAFVVCGAACLVLAVGAGCSPSRRSRNDASVAEVDAFVPGIDGGVPIGEDAGHDAGVTIAEPDAGQPPPVDAGNDAGSARALGARCSGTGQCAAGLECYSVGSAGLCRRNCRTNGDCAVDGPTAQCVGMDLLACTLVCDPRTNVGCNAGRCVAISQSGSTLTACIASGAGAENATCTSTSDCGSGLVCAMVSSSAAACRPICRLNMGNADCRFGATCQEVFTETPVIGVDRYGACLLTSA